MEEELNKLERAFERLQQLQIVPTVTNMESLLQSLYEIREVYNKLKEGETGGRSVSDVS